MLLPVPSTEIRTIIVELADDSLCQSARELRRSRVFGSIRTAPDFDVTSTAVEVKIKTRVHTFGMFYEIIKLMIIQLTNRRRQLLDLTCYRCRQAFVTWLCRFTAK